MSGRRYLKGCICFEIMRFNLHTTGSTLHFTRAVATVSHTHHRPCRRECDHVQMNNCSKGRCRLMSKGILISVEFQGLKIAVTTRSCIHTHTYTHTRTPSLSPSRIIEVNKKRSYSVNPLYSFEIKLLFLLT